MANARSAQPAHVTYYSGRTYADHPASFVWQDKQYEVKEVLNDGGMAYEQATGWSERRPEI